MKHLKDIIGEENIGGRYLNVEVPLTVDYNCTVPTVKGMFGNWFNFTLLGTSFTVQDLIDYGFDSKCGSCMNHYSITFTSGTDTSYETGTDDNGVHHMYKIGIENPDIVDGADFCKYILDKLKEQPEMYEHFQQYGFEGPIFWIFDNRAYNSESKEGRIYDAPYFLIDYIEAEYTGDSILVNNEYKKTQVTVTVYYQDGNTEELPQIEFEVNTLKIINKPTQICIAQWIDSNYKTDFEVPVLYPLDLKVETTQELGFIYENIDTDKLTVIFVYQDGKNGQIEVPLNEDEYEIYGNNASLNTIITKKGNNVFNIKEKVFHTFIRPITIYGVPNVIDLNVEYEDKDVPILTDIDTKKIKVTLDVMNQLNVEKWILQYGGKDYINIDGYESTKDYIIDNTYVPHNGTNTFKITYKDKETFLEKTFDVNGIPLLVSIEAEYIGDLNHIIGDRINQDEIKVIGYFRSDETNMFTEEIKNWNFVTMPIITEVNEGHFIIRYQNLEDSVDITYANTVDLRLNVWYEGAKIKVGSNYNPTELRIYLINDSIQSRTSLTYKQVSINSYRVTKPGWNFFTVVYSNNYTVIKQTFAVFGYEELEHPDLDFQVLYIDIQNDYQYIDLTEKFKNEIVLDGIMVMTWELFLNAVNVIMPIRYGVYKLTLPKESGLSNEYSTEWEVFCKDELTLKATIQKIYNENKEDIKDGSKEDN